MKQLPYDEIQIRDLEVFAHHGVFSEETKLGQKFLVSLTMYTNTRTAGISDCLAQSIDYGAVCRFMTTFLREHTYHLIEAAAEHLASALLQQFPLLCGVMLEIKKPWAPIGLPLDTVSIKIQRFWHDAYIGLGSNLGDKRGYLDFAVERLRQSAGCRVKEISSYMVTKPYGGVAQDDFLNACLHLQTYLPPMELLGVLHGIEQEAHRERVIHWGPRTLDLDILLYDDLVMETELLTIPHLQMHLRDFVLQPLAQIAPYLKHPVLGKTITCLAKEREQESETCP